ncbi:hypothetical protein SNOG_10085 [Parastagonospora nodorum SN15]|uniref:Uncharacterized protein n=1 Tax=Phaeosphaeria nodorum (strain SN15 / ATCC MYA-4574 / FGSC 10173) TaxID=321614 RepID=Q0UDS9_PHANO|nr:hypothetical protein SNOG_10085 [Parastagonospora nodorum SN15]EAT82420.1 hypothetical protein SNOG_10085 [Parastagonospora nodorum SN15]
MYLACIAHALSILAAPLSTHIHVKNEIKLEISVDANGDDAHRRVRGDRAFATHRRSYKVVILMTIEQDADAHNLTSAQ